MDSGDYIFYHYVGEMCLEVFVPSTKCAVRFVHLFYSGFAIGRRP